MSISSFKFVSPGVFVNEVDNSQLPRLPDQMGPVIIGRAERGPAMVPVQVKSFAEFVETFGEPVAGGQGDDVWRQGNKLGPTYGAYAAQAYLKNGSPITFVRLLGDQSPDADTTGKAGWETESAYGLFVGHDSPDHLGAVIYATSASACPVKIDPDGSISSGKIPLIFDRPGTTTPGTVASGQLQFDHEKIIRNADEIVIDSAILATGPDGGSLDGSDLTIKFDNTAGGHTFAHTDADGFVLTVGTQDLYIEQSDPANGSFDEGVDDPNVDELTTRVRNALNDDYGAVKAKDAMNADVDDTIYSIFVTASKVPGTPRLLNVVRDAFGATTSFLTTPAMASTVSVFDLTDGTDRQVGAGDTFKKTVSFNRTDKSSFIREILNTNPTLTNARITSQQAKELYYLGATFEQHIDAKLGGETITHAVIRKIEEFKDYRKPATAPSTPWVLSQFSGTVTKGMDGISASDLSQLFRFHSLYSGEWEQKNFKISIADVKGPNSEFLKYGSFSVLVRDASDSDANPVIYERFTNVNLDPSSPRFISKSIGDAKMVWRETEKRYVQVGEFASQSKFVRVEVANDVTTGAMNPELLPFGFAIPGHKHDVSAAGINGGNSAYDVPAVLGSPNLPAFYLRNNTVDDARLSSSKAAFFGISTDRPNNLGRYDESYSDIVRPLYGSEDMFDVDAGFFTLDKVGIDPAQPTHAIYTSGGLSDGTAINSWTEDANGVVSNGEYTRVLEAGYDKFTIPLCGGTDGLDVHEIEPFCDDLTEGKSNQTSSPYYSISKAIDAVSDPEVVEADVMVMPGFANPGLTGKLISVCEQRADALAIVDIEGDYKPRGWDTTGEESRLPVVEEAISKLKNRGINSSYGCAFFPWVQVRDDINNRLLWMPPSVVALGTLSSSAANSELWFAPAGFTRGGLSQGAGGVPVTQTRLRLSSRERDALYEANINPIAQFPAEGIVVFGQKTLQVTPSALDRINVRRLMIYVKKEISRMAATVLFDQNLAVTWARFTSAAEPFLQSITNRFGLTEFRVVLDETTTTPELVDRNIVYAKIFLKPARAIEYIAIDFVITNSGASFDD